MNENLRNVNIVDDIPEDLNCIKCKKIAICAFSVSCGCSYCKICIENVLNENENPLCVNDGEDCKTEILKMNINVLQNFNIIKKIEKLRTKCVNVGCTELIRLKDILNHLNNCLFVNMSCPYSRVGCNDALISNTLADHMTIKSLDHSTMLIDYVDKFSTDFKESIQNQNGKIKVIMEHNTALNNKVQTLEQEIECLKSAYQTNQLKLNQIDEVVKSTLNIEKIITCYKKNFDSRLRCLSTDLEFERKKNNEITGNINMLKTVVTIQNMELEDAKKNMQNINGQLLKKINSQHSEILNIIERTLQKIPQNISRQPGSACKRRKVNIEGDIYENYDISDAELISDIDIDVYTEFIWTIKCLKNSGFIKSEEFYLKHYKIQLKFEFSTVHKNSWFRFIILDSSMLKWPCNLSFKYGIIDIEKKKIWKGTPSDNMNFCLKIDNSADESARRKVNKEWSNKYYLCNFKELKECFKNGGLHIKFYV